MTFLEGTPHPIWMPDVFRAGQKNEEERNICLCALLFSPTIICYYKSCSRFFITYTLFDRIFFIININKKKRIKIIIYIKSVLTQLQINVPVTREDDVSFFSFSFPFFFIVSILYFPLFIQPIVYVSQRRPIFLDFIAGTRSKRISRSKCVQPPQSRYHHRPSGNPFCRRIYGDRRGKRKKK